MNDFDLEVRLNTIEAQSKATSSVMVGLAEDLRDLGNDLVLAHTTIAFLQKERLYTSPSRIATNSSPPVCQTRATDVYS